MAGGIILGKYAGTSILADADGICAGQSATAGALTLTINGSLTSGGVFSNPGWGYKLKATSAGNDSGVTLTVTGKFWASNAAGATPTEEIQLALTNASFVTSTLYATEVTKIVASTITASSITVGTAADSTGVPVTLNGGSLYQINVGGTFGGATPTVSKYAQFAGEWIAVAVGSTAAGLYNVEVPAGSTVKLSIASGSTTTSLMVDAEIINKQR